MLRRRIEERIARQKAFFASRNKNETLILNWSNLYYLSLYFVRKLGEYTPEELYNESVLDGIIDDYLVKMKEHITGTFKYEDDLVPTPDIFFDIGTVTSSMGGVPAVRAGETIWCMPVIESWDCIEKLRFNPDSIWIRLHILAYQRLLDRWEGDFCPIPYLHHSPLDGAWSLRGDRMLYDFYDYPDMVKKLVDWCAEWSIRVERHIAANTKAPEGLSRGVWGVVLPEGAVFVNGDPIDLISGQQHREFDKPYTEKLFTSTGGGFYHHHALGIRQAANVSKTKGLYVQNIYTDPNQPVPAEIMIRDERVRQEVIGASMEAPIHLTGDFYPFFDELLPILREGRFILRCEGDNESEFGEMLDKLNRVRNNRP